MKRTTQSREYHAWQNSNVNDFLLRNKRFDNFTYPSDVLMTGTTIK